MSDVSGTSRMSSTGRGRGRFVGVPTRCWCGVEVVARTSKSDPNPCRRYFRCAYAYAKKLSNDNHTFKWVDEALMDEVSFLKEQTGNLRENINELITETLKQQKHAFGKLEKELEAEISKKVEAVFLRADNGLKSRINRMGIVGFFGCLAIVGLVRLVG